MRAVHAAGEAFLRLARALVNDGADWEDAAQGVDVAGAYGRELESREDGVKLQEMVDAGQLTVSEFENRDKMLEMVKPVQDAYAAEIGASDLLEAVRAK